MDSFGAWRSEVIAVDTNLLVYAHRGATPEHRAATGAIEEAMRDPRGWGVALPCIAEFWMVVTHPSASGRASTADEARGFLDALRVEGMMTLFEPRAGMGERLINLAAQVGAQGPRIFDLQIGLCALEAGATELWSHDRRFIAPPGLRVFDPIH